MFTPWRITPSIYQDGYITEKEAAQLEELGVTHLLNLDLPYSATRTDMSGVGLRVFEILVHDMSPLTEDVARRIVAVMQRAVDLDGGSVYVHCNAGVSRSPTAVWLYLVATGWDESAATDALAAAAAHLHGPDPILIGDLDLDLLRNWILAPRWELWVEYGGSHTLAVVFDSEDAARSGLADLERERDSHDTSGPEREAVRYSVERVDLD